VSLTRPLLHPGEKKHTGWHGTQGTWSLLAYRPDCIDPTLAQNLSPTINRKGKRVLTH